MIRRRRDISFRSETDWDAFFDRAEDIVNTTIAALPDDVKTEAMQVPCLFRQWARDVYGRSVLGLYTGFQPNRVSTDGSLIFLFVGDILRHCAANGLDFDEEIQKTYLHELGHHLGWDEGDLQKRGLS